MSTITERLKDAVDQFPAIEDHPHTLFFDSLAEIERLQARVSELEAEEEGAKEAFGVIVDKMKDLRSRNLQIEKTIHRQVIEISRLHRSGARPLSNEAEKAGGDDE